MEGLAVCGRWMGVGCRGDRSWNASGVAGAASSLGVRGLCSKFGERDTTVVGFSSIDRPRTRLIGVLPTEVLPLHFSSPPPPPPMPLTRLAVRLRDVSAGDGDALRSLFVVTLMCFFPTYIIVRLSAMGARVQQVQQTLYSTYCVRHSGTIRSSRVLPTRTESVIEMAAAGKSYPGRLTLRTSSAR
jgi:hypothetical protein